MLDDLFEADTRAAVRDVIARPPKAAPPTKKFSAWDLVTAVPRGIAEAGAQIGASLSEVVAGYGDVMGRIESGQSLQGRQPDMQSDLADSLRDRGRAFRPDANDASTAEQLVYGFSRGASKIVGAAMLAGPLGVVGAGAEEALSVSSDLEREGVSNFTTRAKAATVQGAGLALAALPAAAPTLWGTAALYAVGGPGGFMAQQALTREILRGGGYERQAASYDPLDPVGLAVSSLVPLPFAAYGLRQARFDRALKSLPDYADVRDAAPAPSGAAPAPEAAPAFARTAVSDAVSRYPQEWEDAARVLLQTEQRRASNPGGVDLRSQDAHDAALRLAEDQIAHGEPVQVADVAPYLSAAEREANFRVWSQDAPLIPARSGHAFRTGEPVVVQAYHGTTREFDAFSDATLGQKTGGPDARAGHFLSDNPAAADQFTWENGDKSGHIMPAYVRLLNPLVSDHVLNGATGTEAGRILREAKAAGHDGVIFPRSDMLGHEGATFVAFDPRQIKSAIGNSGRFDPTSGSLTDPIESFARDLRAAFAEADGASRESVSPDAPTTARPAPEASQAAAGSGAAPADLAAPGLKPIPGVEPGRVELTPERRAAVQREVIDLRKRESVLRSLLDCLEA